MMVRIKLNRSGGIFVEGCTLTNPPMGIMTQGNLAILKYWAQMEAEKSLGTYINRDVKLVLVGNSDAGKSTLRIFLKDGILSNQHTSTHGMEIVL
ncbi:MAG: hypothetical protein IPP17_00650 [Bacteroidetes bacterium]|nr:hypothetical protein [Bacteroidota bacterium]